MTHLDRLKLRLDSFRPLPPPVVAELRSRFDVQFTYNSNAIEGNTLTQSETEMVIRSGITIQGHPLNEHLEAIGHAQAIDYLEELAGGESIGEREIRELHSLMLRSIDPRTAGVYRSIDVKAAGTNYEYPSHFLVRELMAGFHQWLQVSDNLHPIKRAAQAHLEFVAIHPFVDGNGRTARLLMNLLLLRAGYPIAIIANTQREAYIDAIVRHQTGGGSEWFTRLVAQSVQETLIESIAVASTALECRDRGAAFYDWVATKINGEKG
ncbi:MAG: Fic family protein [Microcoleus sp. SIO2G3]|nr:Fic family protein [Microcoleus sp. SIO2G3]